MEKIKATNRFSVSISIIIIIKPVSKNNVYDNSLKIEIILF